MAKLKLAGQNLDRVFNFRYGRVIAECTSFITEKLPNLMWKIQPKPLLGCLPIAFELPTYTDYSWTEVSTLAVGMVVYAVQLNSLQ